MFNILFDQTNACVQHLSSLTNSRNVVKSVIVYSILANTNEWLSVMSKMPNKVNLTSYPKYTFYWLCAFLYWGNCLDHIQIGLYITIHTYDKIR